MSSMHVRGQRPMATRGGVQPLPSMDIRGQRPMATRGGRQPVPVIPAIRSSQGQQPVSATTARRSSQGRLPLSAALRAIESRDRERLAASSHMALVEAQLRAEIQREEIRRQKTELLRSQRTVGLGPMLNKTRGRSVSIAEDVKYIDVKTCVKRAIDPVPAFPADDSVDLSSLYNPDSMDFQREPDDYEGVSGIELELAPFKLEQRSMAEGELQDVESTKYVEATSSESVLVVKKLIQVSNLQPSSRGSKVVVEYMPETDDDSDEYNYDSSEFSDDMFDG